MYERDFYNVYNRNDFILNGYSCHWELLNLLIKIQVKDVLNNL